MLTEMAMGHVGTHVEFDLEVESWLDQRVEVDSQDGRRSCLPSLEGKDQFAVQALLLIIVS